MNVSAFSSQISLGKIKRNKQKEILNDSHYTCALHCQSRVRGNDDFGSKVVKRDQGVRVGGSAKHEREDRSRNTTVLAICSPTTLRTTRPKS